MKIKQKSFQEIKNYITDDVVESRIIARVFFVNNISSYYSLIDYLSEKADITIRLSDDAFCKGDDTVLDITAIASFLEENKDKDILIPHLGEYLRTGEMTERNVAGLYTILNRHVHSTKRVWIPMFLSTGLFQSIVGSLDEERFENSIFELTDSPVEFSTTVFSKAFAKQPGMVDAVGLKAWFRLWDDAKVKTGMSFATRQIKQISPTNGDYSLSLVTDPFDYVCRSINDSNAKLMRELGTEQQWASIIPYVKNGITISQVIEKALNMLAFDPAQVLGNWQSASSTTKWCFLLWYRLGLNQKSDYVSYAVSKAQKDSDVIMCLESAIIDCVSNTNFDEWLDQRQQILRGMGISKFHEQFWSKFDQIVDTRAKLKILTGATHEERTKIIEIVSSALSAGQSISSFSTILKTKYPDLLLYLAEPSREWMPDELAAYIAKYKFCKISDKFDLSISAAAAEINPFDFDTRGSILYGIKNTSNAYFIWIDGLGVEWIDMLLTKVKAQKPEIPTPSVKIGTAILPTITKINMEKADPDTISEKKFDELDSLSHIKDKSDCNYCSIVAKQYELMDKIAAKICSAFDANPDKDIVITADHGMSRMAAKGFHLTQGVNAPSSSSVCNMGRYCEFADGVQLPTITNTVKGDNVVAFKTQNHFTVSGNAPGELHGGAAPEELLVPIIVYKRTPKKQKQVKTGTYSIPSHEIYLDADRMANVAINSKGDVDSISVMYGGSSFQGFSQDKEHWSVAIPGLIVDHDYSIKVYINNTYSNSEETIHIKRKGLVVDDDL